jgi:Na+/H+-dicarboxylate symporter
MSATAKVLLGVGSGLGAGMALATADRAASESIVAFVEPIGALWLSALQMTVVPLVVSVLIVGIAAASDAASTGRIALRAMVVFAVLLAGATLIAALATPVLFATWPADPSNAGALRDSSSSLPASVPPLSQWLSGIVPANPIRAAADGAILPVVVFALFFGSAITRIASSRRAQLVGFFQAIVDSMMVIVGWVLLVAPIGVFALTLPIGARLGLGVLGAVASFVVITSVVCIAITIALYPVAALWAGVPVMTFARAAAAPQTVAFSTQSSLASLPAMLDATQTRLGLPAHVTAVVLPLAVSLFRATSPAAYIVAAAFSAWLYGMPLSTAQLASGAAVGMVVSLGAVSLPNQVSFMGTFMPVLQTMGVPLEPLGLMLAVSSIPDLFMTVGNVTADVTAAAIVAKQGSGAPAAMPSRG